jgi:hypothetical protein
MIVPMTFLYPLLLGGLVLVGIPVLLHLIMQQKPKHLLFPAFRFLLQRYRTNQRRLRLRHWLLLALRLLLIIGICLALARPKFFSERIHLGDRPIAAVLVFDTSPSMDYVSGGQSRLEAAKQRAQELFDLLPEGSRVAILDTAEPGGQWYPTLSLARDRVSELRPRPANGPVTTRLSEAYRLFVELDQETEGTDDLLPKFLYIFSDRAQNSWDQSRVKDLQQIRDRVVGGVNAVLVDVGVENPVDVALTAVELERQIVLIDDRALLKITVQATGADCDTQLLCRFDGEQTVERKQVKLAAGETQVITFERRGLAVGAHQVEAALETADSLMFNNTLFTTFEIRGGRRVLLLVDEPSDALFLSLALETTKEFRCDVCKLADFGRKFTPPDLNQYQAICMLNVRNPDHDTWDKLASFVKQGGGLAVIPGGEELNRAAYNDEAAAQRLLPGRLMQVVKAKTDAGVVWKEGGFTHPIMAAVREWSMQNVDFQQLHPAATRYWEVERHPGTDVYAVALYDDAKSRPALLERSFGGTSKTRGRVLLLTTPMDRSHLSGPQPWNEYLKTWFYQALAKKTIGYLAGDAEEANFNYLSGQTVTIALRPGDRSARYTLQGPGLSAAESVVSRVDNARELALTQAVTPGNYNLRDDTGKPMAHFSVNPPPDESQLAQVPAEQIEALLGAGSVLPLGHGVNLHDAMQGHWKQPVELFPWLMLLVLLLLVVENLLANKFYRREAGQEETEKMAQGDSV